MHYSISGISEVYWLSDLEKIIEKLLNENTSLYINQNEHYRAKVETETREDRFTN